MNGWMNGRMNEWMNVAVLYVGLIHYVWQSHTLLCPEQNEWIDGWMNEWINGWETSLPWTKLMKVRWIHGWMDGWIYWLTTYRKEISMILKLKKWKIKIEICI